MLRACWPLATRTEPTLSGPMSASGLAWALWSESLVPCLPQALPGRCGFESPWADLTPLSLWVHFQDVSPWGPYGFAEAASAAGGDDHLKGPPMHSPGCQVESWAGSGSTLGCLLVPVTPGLSSMQPPGNGVCSCQSLADCAGAPSSRRLGTLPAQLQEHFPSLPHFSCPSLSASDSSEQMSVSDL